MTEEELKDLYFCYHHEVVRESVTWTRLLDAEGNLLPASEVILIKDLKDDHLAAILANLPWLEEEVMYQILMAEVKYREENIND